MFQPTVAFKEQHPEGEEGGEMVQVPYALGKLAEIPAFSNMEEMVNFKTGEGLGEGRYQP